MNIHEIHTHAAWFKHEMNELILHIPYIPNSIKVALGIGQLRIGKLLFGSHSSKALHCVPYAQMPNAQLPMTNCQSNLF